MNKNIEVLEEVLEVLEEEKRNFYTLINQNDFRIEEISSYLRELSKKEDEDFKVFSPRNVENTHREQIEADISEKKKYEAENAEYKIKIEFLKSLIDRVNIVIANLQADDNIDHNSELTENEKIDETVDDRLSEESIKAEDKEQVNSESIIPESISESEKRHIAHQIMNCVSYITFDTERTKIELTALAKKMMS